MTDLLAIGPLNTVLLLVLLATGLAGVLRALWLVHNGRIVSAVPLALVLALPLGLAVWASNGQLATALQAAATHDHAPARQTLMAMAIQRALLTQLVAGLGVAVLSGVLLLGALRLTVPGERPRLALGQTAMVLGGALVLVALVGFSAAPSVLLAGRAGLYAVAAFAAVTAMIATHRRGPGVQLGALAGLALPLLVASVDQATIAWFTGMQLQQIAVAPAAVKQGMLTTAMGSVASLRAFSGVHLGFAASLALLGPLAAWRRERPLAIHQVMAVGAGVVLAGIGVGWASSWLAAF